MKYLSLCSGIEAASVAFAPLGWTPVAFSEIDPFPRAVLNHRFPDVPNWGDMTKFEEWPDVSIDLICGGTPCQSFSIAGLRKGLDDARGNLMLTFGHILGKYRPDWFIWENVPGVLSSGEGRDFASFLGLVTGQIIEPPPDGWRNAGTISGIDSAYGIAWRVLDAQYTRSPNHPRAVPQRRRRVFVVGHLGDWRRAAAVLFDSESVSRNPAPRREAGKGTPEIFKSRARKCSVDVCDRVAEKRGWCNTHYQRWRKSGNPGTSPVHELGIPDSVRFWQSVDKADTCWNYTGALNDKGYGIYWNGQDQRLVRAHRFAYENVIGEIPEGLELDHLCRNRRCCNPSHLEPVTSEENTRRGNAGKHWAEKRALAADVAPGPPFSRTGNERIEAEAMVVTAAVGGTLGSNHGNIKAEQAWTGQLIVHTLSADGFDASEDGIGRGTPIICVSSGQANAEISSDVSTSLTCLHEAPVVALQERAIRENPDAGPDGVGIRDDGAAYTLEGRTVPQAVAFQQNTRDEVRLMNGDGQVAGCLSAEAGMKQQNYLAIRTSQTSANGHGVADNVAHTLDGAQGQAVAFSCKDSGQDAGEISPTLRSMNFDGLLRNASSENATSETNLNNQTNKECGVSTAVRRFTPL